MDYGISKDGSFELMAGAKSHNEQQEGDKISIRHSVTSSSLYTIWGRDDTTELSIEVDVNSHTPWNPSGSLETSSPEGWFINLPLPLHWHVLSAFSPCILNLRLPAGASQHKNDQKENLQCIAHFEKNWAHSFPRAHNWIQGVRIPDAAQAKPEIYQADILPGEAYKTAKPHLITLAGGLILGIEAYLCGYRNPEMGISIDFRPPFTLNLLPLISFLPTSLQQFLAPLLSPFTYVKRDWSNRSLAFSFSNLWWKLDILASAPANRFYDFAAPMSGGFREKWMGQSLSGQCRVRVWRRKWTLRWELVCGDWFENVGVEFGGEYFPERGQGQKGILKWDGEETVTT